MRDKKIRIIEEITELVKQLGTVQDQLEGEDIKPLPEIPCMHPEELPEK